MKHKTRDQHLFDEGPKRILALDGGGVRGILTLGILKHVESLLKERAGGDEDFRLADYFDLIGGTSTGAIIAAGLAIGMSVDELVAMYRKLAQGIFKKSFWRFGILAPKFGSEPLNAALKGVFGDMTLGDASIRTGLMIMAKRLDTNSPWVIHNNPKSVYFDAPEDDPDAQPNRDFPVTRVVRASTAAPHYFEPERIQVTRGLTGAFVDGGTSPHNNPSLALFLLATLERYGYRWPVGADRLMILSVGTGFGQKKVPAKKVMDMKAAELALLSLAALMDDCNWLGQTVLQAFSRSPTAWAIDSEVGDLQNDVVGGRELLHYLRYNVELDADWLSKHLGLEVSEKDAAALQAMDKPEHLTRLESIGDSAGQFWVKKSHFPKRFDVSG